MDEYAVMRKSLLGVTLSLLITNPAMAVMLGDPVLESEYQDHTVRLEIENDEGSRFQCGGLLIGGEYILTAAHCVGKRKLVETTVDGSYYGYWAYDFYQNSNISVFQGKDIPEQKKIDTSYSVIEINDAESAWDQLLKEHNYIENENMQDSHSEHCWME